MTDKDQKPNLRRRVVIAGGAALLAAAGVGGYAALSAPTMHLAAAVQKPAVTTTPVEAPDLAEAASKAPDTDTLQQGDQTSSDPAPAAPVAAAPAATEKVEAPSGSTVDPAGGPDSNVDFQGNFDGEQ